MFVNCQSFGEDFQFPELTNGAVGGSVKFTPNNLPSEIDTVTWQFGQTFILSGNPDTASIVSAYKNRSSFDKNTLALELWNLKLEDAGPYSLTVISNGNQHRGETSLQVFETIYHVTVTGPQTEALIEGESSANFTSEGSGGTITSVQWMKDNSPLSPNSRIIFSSDNRSVSISPVQRSDTGEYLCIYSNPVSSASNSQPLIINYGPDDVSITGPDVVDLEVQVSLSCSAKSEPSASFNWTFNGSDTGVNTDNFTIEKTDFTDSGEYICTAYNKVTKRKDLKIHPLQVQEGGEAGLGGGLSAGAIAGIVIGVLVAVGGICGLIVYLTKTNKIPKLSYQSKGNTSGAQRGQDAELNYADISHFQKNSGERVVLGDVNELRTEYAEVRHGSKLRAPPPPYGSQVSNPPPVRRDSQPLLSPQEDGAHV
nr:carcinoembryonic antigen-related cell adhesion molecule 20-like [Danio rerio]|eukprot:XP_021328633.1 carcinoembryonic antigen-related cell adhesion molecule 20-like [Danio rerio]